jgi:hypothetical protein
MTEAAVVLAQIVGVIAAIGLGISIYVVLVGAAVALACRINR